jgi:hypothetical protein
MAPLLHPVSDQVRVPPIHFSEEYRRRTLGEDRDIIDRIIAAYHAALRSASPEILQSMCGTIWSDKGLVGKQAGLIQALEDKSPRAVHDILCRYFITDAAHGIAMGQREFEVVYHQPEHRRHYGLMWLDRLVGLAHAIGAVPVPNPEDSGERWQCALEVEPAQVFAAIEKHVGMPIEFPDVCGVFGGEIRGRAFPFIAFTHLLVALSARALVPSREPTIVEIGGGFGGLASWLYQLCRCHYTIFDLPFANAVQAYFLHRALPGRPLVLCGERPACGPALYLQPAWAIFNQSPVTTVELVINQDSMPEIPQRMACRYLQAMKGFLKGPFLSVNQEPAPEASQLWDRTRIAQLIDTVGGYARLSRGPFPLRMGYVQEVYYPTTVVYGAIPRQTSVMVRRDGPHSLNPAHRILKPIRTALALARRGDVRGLRDRLQARLQLMRRSRL